MQPFPVYPLYDITPVRAAGSYLWDSSGQEYLDLYGGHAVISIGHAHPKYVERLTRQVTEIGFYSNSVQIPIQQELASRLGEVSGYPDYALFLVNSGAEANENALKVASFFNQRKKVISCSGAFHGRTAGAVAVTDNPSIVPPVTDTSHVVFVPFNDVDALRSAMSEEISAIIVEGIQGVGGIQVASEEFLRTARQLCDEFGACLILDSVQCGYGRSGKFFTNQFYDNLHPDIITTAKGMGNGFPVGGVLIAPKFHAKFGMLGTTFGGNHLACAAALAVLEVIQEEKLIENAESQGKYLFDELAKMEGIKELRGRGLMIGIEFEQPVAAIRDSLLFQHHIFCGYAGKHTLRLLPSLGIGQNEADRFLAALATVLKETNVLV